MAPTNTPQKPGGLGRFSRTLSFWLIAFLIPIVLIQFAMKGTEQVADIDTSVSALQIPMMFRSWEEVDAVREQIRPVLEKKLEEKGFVVLNWGTRVG